MTPEAIAANKRARLAGERYVIFNCAKTIELFQQSPHPFYLPHTIDDGKIVPAFVGYIFAPLWIAAAVRRAAADKYRLSYLATSAGDRALVKLTELEAMQRFIEAPCDAPDIPAGTRVRIMVGLFEGTEGVVERQSTFYVRVCTGEFYYKLHKNLVEAL